MRAFVTLLGVLVSAVHAGGVSFRRLDLAGEAHFGAFAEDLTGTGRRDLIALSGGRISVFRADPTQPAGYSTASELLVTGPLAYFADVADVLPAKGKEILVMTPDGVSCFAQENGRFLTKLTPLINREGVLLMGAIRAAIAVDDQPNVPVLPWNFAFDANGDGRDDVLVPHDGGTDLYIQTAPGQFAKPIALPVHPLIGHYPAPGARPDALGQKLPRTPWFRVSVTPVEPRDVNGDGRIDLVAGPDYFGRKYWFAHRIDGSFDTSRARLTGEGDEARSPNIRRVDINGDGHLDLFIEDNDVKDVFRILTTAAVKLADANGRLPAQAKLVQDQNVLIHTNLPLYDFDGDGALDFAMFKTDITPVDIGNWIRQCMGKIDGYVNFFLFDRKGNEYPQRPAYSLPVSLRFKVDPTETLMGLVWERYLSTMMRFEGDFNGDGRPDLLVRSETERLSIYFNSGDRRRLFSSRPDIALEKLPDFGGIAISDLNGDGCSDMLLYAPSPPGGPDHVLAAYVSRKQ